MSAHLLDGKALAKRLREELKERFAAFTTEHGFAPTVAIVHIGYDAASAGYARAIEKTCQGVGAGSRMIALPAVATQPAVEQALAALNTDPMVHGIMILEPVPDQIDHAALIDRMDPRKDVDGVHPLNAGRLLANRPPFFVPATPAGGLRLLEEAGVSFKGKHAVIVGRSDIVGKPLALLLLHRHVPVTITHSNKRSVRPSIQLIPAALEAMMTENGLEKEAIQPMEVPPKMMASGTIRSYPAARNSGTRIG